MEADATPTRKPTATSVGAEDTAWRKPKAGPASAGFPLPAAAPGTVSEIVKTTRRPTASGAITDTSGSMPPTPVTVTSMGPRNWAPVYTTMANDMKRPR